MEQWISRGFGIYWSVKMIGCLGSLKIINKVKCTKVIPQYDNMDPLQPQLVVRSEYDLRVLRPSSLLF